MSQKNYLVAIFEDDHKLVHAAQKVVDKNVEIYDIFTPFPVHGLDDLLKIKRTRLPQVTFLAALAGGLFAFTFQWYTSAVHWPINVGGKPFNSWPAFLPITFELTVLIGALTTVGAFLYKGKLFPGQTPRLFDHKLTDYHFAIAIETTNLGSDKGMLETLLKSEGAMRVETKEVF